MTIHFLNCAPMSPWFPRWQLGGTCLLVETEQGLVLVDTGLGLHDHFKPTPMVRFFRMDFGIPDEPDSCAVRQVARLGFSPEAVQHIVMTHLHFDHAGGLPDFPQAQVHLHRREYEAMQHPRSILELAYDRYDFSHQPDWVLYDQLDSEWLGWDAIRLPFTPQIFLVPLFGHTGGHCGVAVQDGDRWIFNCADALPTNAEFDLLPQFIYPMVIGSHVPRLRQWSVQHPDVMLLAGHMWKDFFEKV